MPSHNHYFTPSGNMSNHTHSVGTLSTNRTGSHYHNNGTGGKFIVEGNEKFVQYWGSSSALLGISADNTNSAGSHSHTISGNTGNPSSTGFTGTRSTTESSGSGSSFDIMNPYYATYMWRRTA